MALIKCPECNNVVSSNAAACIKCGFVLNNQTANAKSPGVAVVLNFIWSGLGNLYIGQIGKGIFISIVYFLLIVIIGVGAEFGEKLNLPSQQMLMVSYAGFGLIGLTLIFWICMLISVYNDAVKLTKRSSSSDVGILSIHCPHCRQSLDVPSRYAGQTGQCPDCMKAFTVPKIQT